MWRAMVAVALAWVLALPITAHAEARHHLARPEAIQNALLEASAERDVDHATLLRFLAAPLARRAAAQAGADAERLAQVLPTLTDRELHDLAARAHALQLDPSAGNSGELSAVLKVLGLLLLIVAAAALVLLAVAHPQ